MKFKIKIFKKPSEYLKYEDLYYKVKYTDKGEEYWSFQEYENEQGHAWAFTKKYTIEECYKIIQDDKDFQYYMMKHNTLAKELMEKINSANLPIKAKLINDE